MKTLPILSLQLLETAVNRYLDLDPEMRPKLAALSGKVMAIAPNNIPITLYLFPSANGITILHDYAGTPDSTLKGSLLSLAELGLTHDTRATKQLFGNDLHISGDTEFGYDFKKILDSMSIDWEEHLAKLVGDILAHNIGAAVTDLRSFMSQTSTSLQRNLTEYLQEESLLTPPREAVEDFFADIVTLRDDVARMAARVARLQAVDE